MIKKPRKKLFTKLRAKLKTKKFKSMAFRNRRFSFRRPPFRRPYRRSGGGGNIVYRVVPRPLRGLLLPIAIIGGAIFLFKDQIRPLIDKLKNHTTAS